VELVLLQKLEIKYLTRFRRDWERILAYYPEQLENLSGKSLMAEVLPFIKERVVKKRPKQVYEQKRRGYQWGGGEIQRGFGDASAVALPPGLDSPLLRSSDYYCLDDIFLCRRVNMVKLQRFFGLHRNRFPNELPSVKEGRELLYNYRAVVRIMEALLSEKRGEHKNPDARETTAPVAQKSRSSNSRAQGNRGADNEVCYRTAEEDGDPPEG